ncbi:MAG: glutamyl-tRNA reductase [Planctomycetales bacterium]
MHLQVIHCNYQTADLNVRERLAFTPERVQEAYRELKRRFPTSEHVILSTCNRVELYSANTSLEHGPTHQDIARFLAEFHQIPLDDFIGDLVERTGTDVVRHLFSVASSLDSMVLGEPQIVAQVREAYSQAKSMQADGPLTTPLFERALSVSKRVRTETGLSEGRVSIASVAVGEFGKGIFERFDDKHVLVIGAGQMAEETLRYLQDEGVRKITVINRNKERAQVLAGQWGGAVRSWEDLDLTLAEADVIVSTTGADRPIVDAPRFRRVRQQNGMRPVFILDLGAPRDFTSDVADVDEEVYLYCIDDLQATCEQNRKRRQKELDKAWNIIEQETDAFTATLAHRATGPLVRELRERWNEIVEMETQRLFQKLPHLEAERDEITKSIERIVNKLLHPPMEALRDEAREGTPHGLMDALKKLFHLGE